MAKPITVPQMTEAQAVDFLLTWDGRTWKLSDNYNFHADDPFPVIRATSIVKAICKREKIPVCITCPKPLLTALKKIKKLNLTQ